jgi:spore coat polysaccharide biosynthesis predicted glycosyltransferase SpsG
MPMRRLVAVADAMPTAGLGHLVRSSAVVVALRARGVAVECVANGAGEEAVVDGVCWVPGPLPRGVALLVDSYVLDPADVEGPCAWFDDGRPAPPAARVLISPARPDDGDPRRLHGLQWSCLRPAFWGEPAVPVADAVDRVLVASGGGDPGGAAAKLSAAVRAALPRARLRVVVGPHGTTAPHEGVEPVVAPPHLAGEIRAAQLVVCLAGQTALEAVCLGVPAVVVAAVDNQRPNAERLAATGAAVAVDLDGPLAEAIGVLAADRGRRAKMSAAGRAAVDGFGALRVAAAIDARLLRERTPPEASLFSRR